MRQQDVLVSYLTYISVLCTCNTQTIIKTLPLLRLRYIMLLGNCPLHHFQCKNKRCVPHSKICNANNDCGDNSDEIDGCTGMMQINVLLMYISNSIK